MESVRENFLLLCTTPLYILIILGEILISNHQKLHLYSIKNTLSNLYLMLLNSGIDFAFRIIYVGIVFQWGFDHRMMQWHIGVGYWISLIIAEDFLYYWLHRFDHEIRFFWATHITHHSSTLMNITVGFRSSVFQPLYRFIYFFPLALLGFQPLDIMFMYTATQVWGILVHTELIQNMGWLEYFLVTPSHHRVHHASNPKYLDKNMGMLLIIWDKLFGTFQKELPADEYKPIEYGLTKNLENPNPVTLVFSEWQQIWQDVFQPGISFKQRLLYIFGPPGYSHDGSRDTSKTLRKLEESQNQSA